MRYYLCWKDLCEEKMDFQRESLRIKRYGIRTFETVYGSKMVS